MWVSSARGLPPMAVRLVPHDPRWAETAAIEAARIRHAAGLSMIAVEHIGSTSVPGLVAKPTLDLLGIASSLADLDAMRPAIEAIGYGWHGEYKLPRRRYCTLEDAAMRARLVNLHCYAQGDPEITRHLAFRDLLRADPAVAAEYAAEKRRCAALHPEDSHAYTDCKSAWIGRVKAEALAGRLI